MALGEIATGGISALEVLRRYSPIRDRLRRHVVGVTRTQPITTRVVAQRLPMSASDGLRPPFGNCNSSVAARDWGICRKWLLSGRSTAETCDMRLRGDPENPLDEPKLPHRVAFCQPTDLPFADHVHRFVAFNGPQRPVYGSEP
jgi:hypothetical protein